MLDIRRQSGRNASPRPEWRADVWAESRATPPEGADVHEVWNMLAMDLRVQVAEKGWRALPPLSCERDGQDMLVRADVVRDVRSEHGR